MSGLPNSYDAWRTASEPNYPSMRYKCLCEDCSNPISEGNEYYSIDGFNYCRNCLETHYRTSTEQEETCSECGGTIAYDELAYNIHDTWICDFCIGSFEG